MQLEVTLRCSASGCDAEIPVLCDLSPDPLASLVMMEQGVAELRLAGPEGWWLHPAVDEHGCKLALFEWRCGEHAEAGDVELAEGRRLAAAQREAAARHE